MTERGLQASRLTLLVTLVAALTGRVWGGSNEGRARDLLLANDFDRVNRVEALAPGVTAALSKTLGNRTLVNPPYLSKASVAPAERKATLLFAGKSPLVWFIHYQLGDEGPTFHVAVVTIDSKGAGSVAGHLKLKSRAWSPPELKNMVQRGDFDVVD